jgi:hypothetical protein
MGNVYGFSVSETMRKDIRWHNVYLVYVIKREYIRD